MTRSGRDFEDEDTNVDTPTTLPDEDTPNVRPCCHICGGAVVMIHDRDVLSSLPDECVRADDGKWYWCNDIGLVGYYPKRK